MNRASRLLTGLVMPLCLCGLVLGAPAMAQTPPDAGGAAARKAGVIALTRTEVPLKVALTGQAAAVEDATVRPLVGGIITGILYEPGHEVEQGAPLFSIDAQSYEAALASAQASLRSAEAAVPAAQATVDRYQKLLGTGATGEQLETAQMTLAQAQAAVAVAEAAVQVAQIDLDRATIRSPVAGVPDVPGVSIGDLVTSGQSDALTTVTALDPINVDLSEASARMLEMRARIESGAVKPGDRLEVSLMLENGQVFAGQGTLSSVGSRVSTSTGTVRVRFRFDNPDRLIMPGMFVRATLTLGSTQSFLIPQMAASIGADGDLTIWTLDGEDRAVETKVTPIGSTDSAWIVAEGQEDGTRLLVDNIENMTGGTQIDPVAVAVSAAGLIVDDVATTGGN